MSFVIGVLVRSWPIPTFSVEIRYGVAGLEIGSEGHGSKPLRRVRALRQILACLPDDNEMTSSRRR